MGIDISVGVLLDESDIADVDSRDYFKHYRELFAFLELELPRRGLGIHQEPFERPANIERGVYDRMDGRFLAQLKSDFTPLKFVVDDIAELLGFPLPHVDQARSCGSVYVPLYFEEPFLVWDEILVGSSVALARECCVIASALGILDEQNPWGDSRFWADNSSLSAQIENAHKIEGKVPFVDEDDFTRQRTGCAKLLWASKKSLDLRASIVID